jgi:AraC-like DNA-binding protein
MKISISVVKEVAKEKFNLVNYNDTDWFLRRFRSLFGCSPKVLTALFNTLLKQNLISTSAKVQHLMWALAFLKSYNTESYFAMTYRVSEKTIRKWIWFFLERISQLDVVSVTG